MDRVLIVDDNRRMLNNMESFISRYEDDFEVITADSGENAIAALKKTRVDLLITDLVMPGIDGLSLLAHINEFYPRTMCIAMTGYVTDNIASMLPDNLLYFIRKPFKLYEFISIIKKSLKGKPPSGTIGGISIPSFLQLIEMDEKSCTMDVTLPDKKKGAFLFKEGVLYEACFETLRGEEAAVELIKKGETAVVTLNPLPKRNISRQINSQIMGLLLKAAGDKDQAPQTTRHVPLAS